ncbi:MAG: hypothetical protein KF778_07715 [Rhodocyclaceae bacterium]|nr:hypothetical protein [Rhodocyclaceae bacterium]MBX3668276.1 hypothetical protein [Rhodocyclaceae bacterium]
MAAPTRYLFERLEAGGEAGPALETVVALQLSRLVAIHAWELPPGMAEMTGLGMPSPVDLGHAGGEALRRTAERLEALIRRYEPRLIDARVRVDMGGVEAMPRLVVEAMLASDNGPQAFYFPLPRD